MYGWTKMVKCRKCGHIMFGLAEHSNVFEYPCPSCAQVAWTDIVCRNVSDAVWWKPWTWARYHWEEFE